MLLAGLALYQGVQIRGLRRVTTRQVEINNINLDCWVLQDSINDEFLIRLR